MLPAKGLYFKIIVLQSMTESMIQIETFPKDFCSFDIILG